MEAGKGRGLTPPSSLSIGGPASACLSSPSSGDEQKLLRRLTPLYQVQLERVLGLTVTSNAALDCDPNSGTIAYPAGCTVVLFNIRKSKQYHVQNFSRKTVTCVTFSTCGRYIATGECGHQPFVRVWDANDRTTQIAEFQGHKYGVSCVAFSPIQNYVVSVGSQHDMIVNVWDWKTGTKIASNKFSSKVKAVSFAENGSYFVTVGNRHVKFWYLEVARGSKFKEPVPLTGRSAILGEQRNNYFCDVACGRGEMGDSTFAITKSGLLCEFNNRRLLDKWVELRTTSANCLVVGEHLIFVGCSEAIIRCFNPFNLQFVTTLPRTHYLGVDVSVGLTIKHMGQHPQNSRYPDTVAVAYDPLHNKLTAVYNDHSLYIWDVTDIKRVGKSHSFLYHSACIWGVENYPDAEGLLPPGSFITCSSDDTIRIWNIAPELPPHPTYRRNIYSNELLRVLYVDSELTLLKDTDISPSGQNVEKNIQDASYDSRNGVRCIKISSDGRHIASGDRAGNIRIHELENLEELCKIEAHDAEVLCLEYSRPDTQQSLLASASRDRLIHVFDVDQDYRFLQTLDDHSSAITCVRFYRGQDRLQMVSCSADRSIIFRNGNVNANNEVNFNRSHNISGKTTLYDMEVDFGQRHILTACQDRNIRVYNVNSGKLSKTFRGATGDDGSLIKVVLDDSGIYAATSCTDKNMCVYDYYSGDCLASMFGHSELVTGLKFSNDGQHLISVSGDGCIFLWKLPREMVQTIAARKAQQSERATKDVHRGPPAPAVAKGPPLTSSPLSPDILDRRMQEPDYRFNAGQLPAWAKKKVNEGTASSPTGGNAGDMPKGRWAQKVHSSAITFKSHYDTDSVINLPSSEKCVGDSESSKESSLEDALTRGPKPNQGLGAGASSKNNGMQAHGLSRTATGATDDSDGSSMRVDGTTTDHDGDIEDCSEQDDTEPEQTMYYPHNDDTVSEFQVNAMDIEELRRSQRRQRMKGDPAGREMTLPLSQDSDEEDASTPSADAAERTMFSMLSCESVDKLGRRESFLKSTYESLDAENQSPDRDNKNSISYRFNARHKEPSPSPSGSSRKEELLKKIEETRRKLQTIGYKSSLRSSKSISDLSNMPEKDNSFISLGGNAHNTTAPDGWSGDSGFSSSTAGATYNSNLRRACSLSDLTHATSTPKKILPDPTTVGGRKTSSGSKTRGGQPGGQAVARAASGSKLGPEDHQQHSRGSGRTLLISSGNKMTPRALKRKSFLLQAMSTGDIRSYPEDSSSEDNSPSEQKNQRNRSLHHNDRRGGGPMRATSERDLTKDLNRSMGLKSSGGLSRISPRRQVSASDLSRPSSAASTVDMSPEDISVHGPAFPLDLDVVPLNQSVVESICEWTVESCERLGQLWWKLCSEGALQQNSEDQHLRAMRTIMLGAAARAQHALSPLTGVQSVGTNLAASGAGAATGGGGGPSMASGEKDPRVVTMMQQYTDMLVNMVQQKMAAAQSPGPT